MNLSNIDLKKIVDEYLDKIYEKKRYPEEKDFIISKENIIKIFEEIIKQEYIGNYYIFESDDSPYMMRLIISISKDIPNICNSSKFDNESYYRYGELNITFSRLANFAFYHWYKFSKLIFISFGQNILYPPHIAWCSILNNISSIISRNNIYILGPEILLRRCEFEFEGKKYNDNKPNVLTLLFDEELTPPLIIPKKVKLYNRGYHLHFGRWPKYY